MKKIILAALILIPVASFAQISNDAKNAYLRNNNSLFDPSKLSMHQSYSLGYYSGGGRSGSVGYYLNSLEYSFSNPLKIRLDLGFLHSPSSILGGRTSVAKSGVFIPGLSVDWKPSQYFHFRLDYQRVPAYNYGGPFYYNPAYGEDNF